MYKLVIKASKRKLKAMTLEKYILAYIQENECAILLFFHKFHSFFLTTSHIIAISSKISMKYIIIGDNKELASIEAVIGKDTISAPPAEIIWDESSIGRSEGIFHYFPSILTGP